MIFYYKSNSAFLISSLLLCSILVESFNNGGVTVDLIHRDSPHSPSYDSSSSNTRFQRQRSAFDRAFSRKTSLASSLSRSLDSSIDAPLTSGGGEYLMKIKIGTPPVEQLGIADTGSDLTWTQCEPCTQCYNQDLPLFDPSRTSSYRPISYESDQCASASAAASCDSNNTCQYKVKYGDRSYSIGELAVETLTFDGGVPFPKVAFGCGHNSDGTFSEIGSGIFGLGGGSISIINQLQSSIGGKFSYCLSSDANGSSKISFGSNAVVGGPNAVSTPLVRKSPATFYYLTLEGVSVGTARVELDDYSSMALGGNIIIDSGTTLTFIPPEFYEGVVSTLDEAITATRVSDPRGMFKMCYQSEGGFSSPTITAHFKGADLVLPEGSNFVEVDEGAVCFTLVPSQDLAIFGNLHQINYHIGYDLVKEEVIFLPTDCSKSL
ncbi:hypothetical protein C2S52_002721 [Perilla frutescens var. hirtella]|nr:hypothetical protein C2S51_012730 [Perilla frutescens var. frutescens]KAH6792244.1 hypothetical protein C2S52_002721 [Perilla frutescens var. hirtella]